ncbi:acyltransferase family protein [Mesorhizobium sp. ANAO-SY3R2]|uniref:acyltransferase family protein n=1 Tax=Mesorhizobium sp. ANAO-SY3R2 TaxID=3166644 RepID=UPI0036727B61
MRNNSFDFMRFVAAVAVLVSHHKSLSGATAPAMPIFRDSLGGVAVCVFFAMSGFLIYQSLERSARWNEFFAARLARLMPNLAFALVLTSLVMMLWFRNFDQLAAHVGYVKNNLLMFFRGVQFTIPGVLEGRPQPGPNGSLWTLPYEFWLYVALFAIFLLTPRLRLAGVALAFVAAGALWMLATPGEHVRVASMAFGAIALGKLGSYFFAGALLASLWPLISHRLSIVAVVALAGAGLSIFVFPAANPALALTFSMLVIALSLTRWAAPFGKYGDASYGVYIFAFPVQQLTLLAIDGFYASMAAALVITIALGYMTWHLFEERCVLNRHALARLLAMPFRRHDPDLIRGSQRGQPQT